MPTGGLHPRGSRTREAGFKGPSGWPAKKAKTCGGEHQLVHAGPEPCPDTQTPASEKALQALPPIAMPELPPAVDPMIKVRLSHFLDLLRENEELRSYLADMKDGMEAMQESYELLRQPTLRATQFVQSAPVWKKASDYKADFMMENKQQLEEYWASQRGSGAGSAGNRGSS